MNRLDETVSAKALRFVVRQVDSGLMRAKMKNETLTLEGDALELLEIVLDLANLKLKEMEARCTDPRGGERAPEG